MNLNPSDGHIMDFLTGWDERNDTGSINSALTRNYINQAVWNMSMENVAIVRHKRVFENMLFVFFCIHRKSKRTRSIIMFNYFHKNKRYLPSFLLLLPLPLSSSSNLIKWSCVGYSIFDPTEQMILLSINKQMLLKRLILIVMGKLDNLQSFD